MAYRLRLGNDDQDGEQKDACERCAGYSKGEVALCIVQAKIADEPHGGHDDGRTEVRADP